MQRLLAIAAAKDNSLAKGWLVPVVTPISIRPQISQVPQALASMGFNKATLEQPPVSEPHIYLFYLKGEATPFSLKLVNRLNSDGDRGKRKKH